jgi:Fe-S oxidoreductase
MHTTRGRARLLFEMLRGEVLHDCWRSEPVKEALDLCLACKGCKGECPVHVDMATYKAEFLAHYYKGFTRLRPLRYYVFGYIHRWARIASVAPKLANFFSQTGGFSDVMKWIVGIAPERQIPAFATENFKSWFAKRTVRNEGQPRVILWPDTFNTYFHPQISKSAVTVLEDAGFQVIVPQQNMCCGRPFYDFGLLEPARKYLLNILHTLAAEIEAGTPVVVLEPSCCSVFRDELLNLLPHNENAARLNQQTFTLAEFLTRKAPNYRAPVLRRKAVLHGHCHHKSLLKMNADHELMRRMQLDFDALDSGCCGMAGAFGFEKGEHYNVSIKCGERVLLPRVRSMYGELLITDGFSCHEQIRQQTGKEALHLAQVVEMAIDSGEREKPKPSEPRESSRKPQHEKRDGHGFVRPIVRAGAIALSALAVAALAHAEKSNR